MLELTESLINEYLDESITEGYYDRSTGMRVENVWPIVEITIQAGEDFDSFKNILETNKNSIVAACTNSSSYRLYRMTSNKAAKRIIIKVTSEPTVWKYYDSDYSLGSSLDQDYSKALFIKDQQVYDEATIIDNIKKLLGTSKAITVTVDYGFYCAANCPSGTYYITEAKCVYTKDNFYDTINTLIHMGEVDELSQELIDEIVDEAYYIYKNDEDCRGNPADIIKDTLEGYNLFNEAFNK